MKYFLMAFSGILMFGCILVGLDRYPEISLVILPIYELVKIKVFLKALFAKNQPEKPKKCAFLPQKWQKCPSCEHIIKVQFYCPFCGQRVRERHYEWINDKLTFGPTDGWGVNT